MWSAWISSGNHMAPCYCVISPSSLLLWVKADCFLASSTTGDLMRTSYLSLATPLKTASHIRVWIHLILASCPWGSILLSLFVSDVSVRGYSWPRRLGPQAAQNTGFQAKNLFVWALWWMEHDCGFFLS